ncbi:hypothetical protein [Streptomyces sp. URMC 124]|uniref:hypothetical protein n=1 Tax=Streptomyces sp. URMC 124 TaxID=3423405 RepID=UPI003F194672
MNTALTLGGIAAALAILYANLRSWWKGKRDWKAILPFAGGGILGGLATVCIGGALGWGAVGAAAMLSEGGDSAVHTVVGTGGAPVARASAGTLTGPGGVVVFLIFVAVAILFKASSAKDRWRIVGGFSTFAALGVLPAVAGVILHLVLGVNAVGDWGLNALNGGSV